MTDQILENEESQETELEDRYSDAWAGELMAQDWRKFLRHSKAWGWCIFDGIRWKKEASVEAMQCAKITARKMYKWAAEEFDDSEARKLATFGNKALSRSGLINMIEMSKVELNVSETEFDTNDYLFNTPGGTINLKEYSYHAPDPKNMITMLAGTSYTPDAVCPRWKQFLAEVMPDESMRLFLQRAVGYSLSGSTKEQCLFFLYGSGANGKSTFLKVIQTMLGEYGRQMLPTVLLAGERHPTELAALAGVRFACTVEVEEGRKMAEVLVKQLTGQDKIAARHLFKDQFEFDPKFKIWLAANHKPIIRGQDHAIWRRMRLIPFTVTIPENKRNPDLADELIKELPGILNWAITGCQDWLQDGLQIPELVKVATAGYRAEMDTVGTFIEDACVLSSKVETSSGELYKAFCAWCEASGERPITQMSFSLRLEEKGFEKVKTKSCKVFKGIGVEVST